MPDDPAPRRRTGFLAFWTSLPGVLTGVAAVIAAVGTLAAVFHGGGSGDSGSGGAAHASSPAAAAESTPPESSPGDAEAAKAASAGCFGAVFEGISAGRVAPVEAGTTAFDVLTSSEPKAGPIGLRFTDHGRTVGGIKVTWYPVNDIFRVESVVDGACRSVEDYADIVDRGQKDVMENSDALRIRLAGRYYELGLNGGSLVRVSFLQVAP
jgi:hypothetical protein